MISNIQKSLTSFTLEEVSEALKQQAYALGFCFIGHCTSTFQSVFLLKEAT
jgi:hypothetical protein